MRTLFLSLLCLFGALTILQAQDSSYGIAYQAVARDADGDPLADTELAVRVSLKDGATTVWQEEHASVLTNQFGNLALTIGSGVTSAGTSLADVDWSAAGLHFEIEVDAGTGTYASFGDVAVQAVPVAMYALNGQEEEIAALWTALGNHEGDFNSFVTATNSSLSDLAGQISANDGDIADLQDQDGALLGMIQGNDGDISLLQIAVDQNTADLGDIFAAMILNPDGSVSFPDVNVEDLTVNGTLDIPGVFSAATGLFNYLSAGNADFEEVLIESANVEDLTFVTGRALGPDSHLDIDGTLNVDGASNFNGTVTVPAPVNGTDAATKGYVDAADAAIQADVDQNEADSDSADATLQGNIDAEATARANADSAIQADVDQNEADSDSADAAIQSDVDQNEADSDAADATLQGNIDAEATARANADAAIQSDVDQNEADSDAADATLQGNIDAEATTRANADNALQSDINDNEYRIANAAAASGFQSGELNGVDNVPTHPGYTGTNHLDAETTLVDADVALDAAIAAETSRAMGAEGNLQTQITTNATDLAAEISRATNRENQIEADAAAARGIIAANLAQEILDREADVNSEESRALAAEGVLQGNIDAEATTRANADITLQNNIDAEATTRANADLTLQSNIDAEVTRATGAEAALQNAINAEVTRATGAEQAIAADLQQEIADRIADVNAEESRALTAEGVLQANIEAEAARAMGVESALQSELDATQTGAGLNADGTYTSSGTPDGTVYINGASNLRNADQQLDWALQNEKSQRQYADAQLDAAIDALDADLQGQITGNDGDIEALQNQVDLINLAAPGGPEWTEILQTAQYFQNSGNTVQLEAPYNGFYASSIQGSTGAFQSLQVQTLTVDNAASVQELTVVDNMHAPDGTIDIFDATQVEIYDSLIVGGNTRLGADLYVTGLADIDQTLNVAGETTLGDNTSIDGDLDVTGTGTFGGNMDVTGTGSFGGNTSVGGDLSVTGAGSFGGTVTAADATQSDHLASFGQLTTAADSLQQNINDEIAARIADVNAEETRAMAAELALQTAIDNEVSRATGVEDSLGTALANEISRAQTAEGLLNGRADSLATAVAGNDSEIAQLQTDLSNEVTNRINDVDAEESRAMTAEGLLNGRADSLATAVAGNDADINQLGLDLSQEVSDRIAGDNALNGRADSLATAVASNDGDIFTLQQNLQQEITDRINDVDAEQLRAETAEGLLNGRADSLASAVASNDGDILALQQDLQQEITDRTNADITISDSLQQNIVDEKNRAMIREGELQSELDATQTGAGLAADGSYNANSGTSYIDAATSLDNADDILDTALKTEETRAITREDSIISVLYWNLGPGSFNPSENELTLDPGIDNIDLDDTDMNVDILNANTVGSQNGNFENMWIDEAEVNNLQSDDISAGDIITQNIRWTHALAWGSNSTTDLEGTLNVDGVTTLNDSLDVDGNAVFHSSVWVDENLDVDGRTTLDSTWVNEYFSFDGGDFDVYSNDEVMISASNDLWIEGQESGIYFEDDVDGFIYADDSGDDMLTIASYYDINITAREDLGIEMSYAEDDMYIYADDIYLTQGDVWVDNNLDVDGTSNLDDTDIDGTLDVSGQADFHDDVNIDIDLNVTGNANVDGITTVDSLNASMGVDFESTLNVDGQADFQDDVNIVMDLDVDGTSNLDDTDIDGTLDVSGQADFHDDVNIDIDLNVTGNADVDGITTVDSLNASLGVTFDSTLDVDGVTTLDSLNAAEGVDFDSTLNVDGQADFQNDVNIDIDLDVNGVTTLDSLNVHEDADFDQDVLVNGSVEIDTDLDVDGRTTLDSTWIAEYFQFNGTDFDVNASDSVTVGANTINLDVTDANIAMSNERIDIALPNSSVLGWYSEIEMYEGMDGSALDMYADYLYGSAADAGFDADTFWVDAGDLDLYNTGHAQWISEDDMVIGTNDDGEWVDTADGYDTDGGDYIYIVFDAEEDYSTDMNILSNEGSELQLISYEDIYLNAGRESAEIEMSNADNAIALDADSVIVTGLFSARGAMDVDGAATMHSTLHVDGNTDVDGDFDVDGITTVDSLNASLGVDFDSTLHVDGNTDVDGDFDVDGITTLDSLNASLGVTFDSTLDVDGVTTLDSLNASEGVYFQSTLEVDGTSQFNDDVNVDATLTADSATTEYHLMVQTPDMVLATVGSAIYGMPEFEVQNMNDVPVFQVDGHTEMTTVKDVTVTNSMTIASSAGLNVAGSFTAGQAITSSQAVYAGPSGTSGSNGEFQDSYWPGDTDYNQLVRKDYVDFHRVSETDVPQAYSYDASLITSSALDPDYNEAVYYMNGNVVLYEDSLDQDNKNYLFTVRGVNFDMIRDGNTTGLVADDEVIGYLWAENNSYELTITRVSDTELTFELGYDDINGIVACTDGVVRPTLSIGGLNNQQNMTGLTFFLDIVASTLIP